DFHVTGVQTCALPISATSSCLPSRVLPDSSGAVARSPLGAVAMPSEPVTKLVSPPPPDVPPEPQAEMSRAAAAAPAVKTARRRTRVVRFERWGARLAALM